MSLIVQFIDCLIIYFLKGMVVGVIRMPFGVTHVVALWKMNNMRVRFLTGTRVVGYRPMILNLTTWHWKTKSM
jgi:hypothetical protein